MLKSPTMISLAQIKAARALLGWTQETLAHASQLSLPGINNLERGLTSPRKDTLISIEKALVDAGIEFIDTTGVRLKTPDVSTQIFEGAEWLAEYDRDIMTTVKDAAQDVLLFSCSDRSWMTYGSVSNAVYSQYQKDVGFKHRILVPSNIDFIACAPEEYRLLDPSYFGEVGYQIYGDKLAHLLWPARKVIVNKSKELADSFRAQFDMLWRQAKPFTAAQLNKIERLE